MKRIFKFAQLCVAVALLFVGFSATLEASADTYAGIEPEFLKQDHLDLEKNLESFMTTTDGLVRILNETSYQFLCLGEVHDLRFRNQLAEQVLSKLQFDAFFIETTDDQVAGVIADHQAGKASNFLGAPFDQILKAALAQMNSNKIRGIDQRRDQAARATFETIDLQRSRMGRETFIAQNIIEAIDWSQKTVSVYGRSHCSESSFSLGIDIPFFKLLKIWSEERDKKVINVKFIVDAEKTHGTVLGFFRRLGWPLKRPLALVNLRRLQPKDYNYRQEIRELIEGFDHVILMP